MTISFITLFINMAEALKIYMQSINTQYILNLHDEIATAAVISGFLGINITNGLVRIYGDSITNEDALDAILSTY